MAILNKRAAAILRALKKSPQYLRLKKGSKKLNLMP